MSTLNETALSAKEENNSYTVTFNSIIGRIVENKPPKVPEGNYYSQPLVNSLKVKRNIKVYDNLWVKGKNNTEGSMWSRKCQKISNLSIDFKDADYERLINEDIRDVYFNEEPWLIFPEPRFGQPVPEGRTLPENFIRRIRYGCNRLLERTNQIDFGVYSYLPIRNYFAPVKYNANKIANITDYLNWRSFNRRMTYGRTDKGKIDYSSGLSDLVTTVYPSLYTFYDLKNKDILNEHKAYINYNLEEAFRYKRPVKAFVWPRYHDSNKTLKHSFIPLPLWETYLEEICKNGADLVLWDWYGWVQRSSDIFITHSEDSPVQLLENLSDATLPYVSVLKCKIEDVWTNAYYKYVDIALKVAAKYSRIS